MGLGHEAAMKLTIFLFMIWAWVGYIILNYLTRPEEKYRLRGFRNLAIGLTVVCLFL